jgi:hypothetical protein
MSSFREFLEALLWGERPMRRKKPLGAPKPDPIERLSGHICGPKCWHTTALAPEQRKNQPRK